MKECTHWFLHSLLWLSSRFWVKVSAGALSWCWRFGQGRRGRACPLVSPLASGASLRPRRVCEKRSVRSVRSACSSQACSLAQRNKESIKFWPFKRSTWWTLYVNAFIQNDAISNRYSFLIETIQLRITICLCVNLCNDTFSLKLIFHNLITN